MDATLEITKVLAALDRKKETHKLSHYKPYGFQIAFHNALGFKTDTPASQRALMAGNKVGKCNSISVKIETSDGEKSLREVWGKAIEVLTWPDRAPRRVR